MIRELGIDRHCSRSDIVGMGCNAGLNALNLVAGWSAAHPGELAVVLCTEACSAAYAMDGSMRTAVVNSLFGDGAGAVALLSGPAEETAVPGAGEGEGPTLLKFASCIIPEAVGAMRYDWDRELERFSFYLDPQVPYVVGAHAEIVIDKLLGGTGLRRSDIKHWLVHSGGKKVIDSVVVNLGLTRHDLRHTVGVLRDYGNVSSGSFLFSYERLLDEKAAAPGDYGVLMTMGPGSTLETVLVQW
jgi:alkylresorcinol/alkylpyrone synthase/polyketide synthase Type III